MFITKKNVLTGHNIETERLQLSSVQVEDAEFIFNLLNSAGWLKFIGDRNIHTLENASTYIETLNRNSNIVYWKVTEKQTGNKLGIITLVKRDFLTHADIGFAFLPQFMEKGFAFEATNVILNLIFDCDIDVSVMAITNTDNASSIRLLEKIGMKMLYETTENDEPIFVYQINKI